MKRPYKICALRENLVVGYGKSIAYRYSANGLSAAHLPQFLAAGGPFWRELSRGLPLPAYGMSLND